MADIDRKIGGEPVIGSRVGGNPEDEREHFYACPQCGQLVDMRDLGAVLHHEDAGHEPLPSAVAQRVKDATAMLKSTITKR